MEGYCVKCKAKREIAGEAPGFIKGRSVMTGNCGTCTTRMVRFMPGEKAMSEGAAAQERAYERALEGR